MGLYKTVSEDDLATMQLVAAAKSYTLYQRQGAQWYVNFRADGRQHRLSTGLTDEAEARCLIEALRGTPEGLAGREVDDRHLIRMIERARYRNRKKGVPFALSMALLREVAARCAGRCEVTGRPLEDDGPFRPSLDRMDPALGYVPGNIRIVCLITNTAMLHYGEAAFAEIAMAYCRRRGLLDASP